MSEIQEIADRFQYHKPSSPHIADMHTKVRETLFNATEDILELLPVTRESSLFVTKMEEAMFWANASIARNLNYSSGL